MWRSTVGLDPGAETAGAGTELLDLAVIDRGKEIERSVALAEAGRGADRLMHVVARGSDRRREFDSLRKQRGEDNGDAPQVMLRADRSLDYGKVMLVMGELNRAGLNRVSLVTTGSSDRP